VCLRRTEGKSSTAPAPPVAKKLVTATVYSALVIHVAPVLVVAGDLQLGHPAANVFLKFVVDGMKAGHLKKGLLEQDESGLVFHSTS
jgi:hypothetical protein